MATILRSLIWRNFLVFITLKKLYEHFLTFQDQVLETKMKKMKYGTFRNYYLWVEEYQLHHGGELEWRYILVDLCYFPKTLNRYLEEIRKVAIIKRKKKLLIFHRNGSFTLLFMPMKFFLGRRRWKTMVWK